MGLGTSWFTPDQHPPHPSGTRRVPGTTPTLGPTSHQCPSLANMATIVFLASHQQQYPAHPHDDCDVSGITPTARPTPDQYPTPPTHMVTVVSWHHTNSRAHSRPVSPPPHPRGDCHFLAPHQQQGPLLTSTPLPTHVVTVMSLAPHRQQAHSRPVPPSPSKWLTVMSLAPHQQQGPLPTSTPLTHMTTVMSLAPHRQEG